VRWLLALAFVLAAAAGCYTNAAELSVDYSVCEDALAPVGPCESYYLWIPFEGRYVRRPIPRLRDLERDHRRKWRHR
jgi:hypothetical protein